VRYLVISDIHGNRQALNAVLSDASRQGFDATLCLGDLVGYGADPGPVLDTVAGLHPAAIVRGNHDKVCCGLEPATLFNEAARRSVEWTARALTPAQIQALRDLPEGPVRVTDGLQIAHGAPFDEDYYVFDETDAARAMAAMGERICLVGHTHVPALFTERGQPDREADRPDLVRLPANGRVLLNVGAVGQPRDGDPRAAYGIIDLPEGLVMMRRVSYDVAGAQEAIREAGLPAWLAQRLERGQ